MRTHVGPTVVNRPCRVPLMVGLQGLAGRVLFTPFATRSILRLLPQRGHGTRVLVATMLARSDALLLSVNNALSLNLRHDLKRMSDAQLAERLERIWQDYSQAEAGAWPYKLLASFRGPFRHPSAYLFFSWVGVGTAPFLIFSPFLSFSISGLRSKRYRTFMRMHLTFCEARDITAEMKRRVGLSTLQHTILN